MLQTALAETGGSLRIDDAWVRETPPGTTVTAGYLTIVNGTAEAKILVAGHSPELARVELHRTVTHQGMARMERQEAIPIPSGAELVMSPGGYHLMLIGANRTLKAGDTLPLTLMFEDGEKIELSVPVRRAPSSPSKR